MEEGVRDGGLFDARSTDGGDRDAAPRDATPIDATTIDGGPPADAGPPRIILDQEAFNFGALRPDQTAPHSFTITNAGGTDSGPVAVSIGGADPSAFALDGIGCMGRVLTPGTGCSVTVTFTTATPGARHAILNASADPGGVAMATLDGSGLSAAALSADPPGVDFGTVTTGATSTVGVSIRNGGALATGTLFTQIGGADAGRFGKVNDTCDGNALGPSSSCTVSITFNSATAGAKEAVLTVGDGTRSVEVSLDAIAMTPGALSLTSVPTFSAVAIGGTSTGMLTVKNTGGTAISGLMTEVSGSAASDFTRSPDGCNGQSLAAGASCSVTIRFAPSVAGIKSASFAVSAPSAGTASTSFNATATARLSVATAGEGSGSVSSNPVGVLCASGSTAGCVFDFAATSVTLTPMAASNSTFDGWTGGGCSGMGACTVSLATAQSVTATFSLRRYTVTLMKTGHGGPWGRVTTVPAGIDCGSGCTMEVTAGQSITLSATDGPPGATGSVFRGWSGGGCGGTGPCLLTPSSDVTIAADFKGYIQFQALLNGCPFGACSVEFVSGRIFSIPAGIDLEGVGVAASMPFVEGTVLEFTAVPSAGAAWSGWLGGSGPEDKVEQYSWRFQNPRIATVENQTYVITYFTLPRTLTVNVTGSGIVTSIPPGIACPGTCSGVFAQSAQILLRADRAAIWPTECAAGTLCEISVNDGRTVDVTFP